MLTKKSLVLRLISISLCLAFVAEQLSAAPESLSIQGSPGVSILNNPASLEVSPDFSTIKEIHPGTNGSLIIHIQDAHANFSAQDNLAKTLRELMEKYGASLVLSEGGWGDCTLTWLKAKADAKVLKREARRFLMAGKMQGEEYLNLTSELPMKIVGIEDEALYAQGLGAYQSLVQNREKAQDHLMKIRRAIEKLKNKLYPEPLRAYERQARLSEERWTDPVAFLTLARETEFDLAAYPALSKLKEILTKPLKDLAMRDLDGIFEELKQAEDVLYTKLLLTRDARLLRTVDRFVGLLELAHRIQMSSEQYAEFKRNEPDFKTEALEAFLNRKLAEAGYFEAIVPLSGVLDEGRKALDLFYETARERDLAFIRSTEESMKSSGQKMAFLIAGGYHTEHLKKLLAERGFGYAVLSPVVKAPTHTQKYERILLGKTDTQRAALLAVENGARLAELEVKTRQLTAKLIDRNPKRLTLKTFFKRTIIALAAFLTIPAEGREDLPGLRPAAVIQQVPTEAISPYPDIQHRVSSRGLQESPSEFMSLQADLRGHLESYFTSGDLVDRFKEDFGGQLKIYHEWLSEKFKVDRQTLSDFAIDMDIAKKIDWRKYPSFLNSENLAGKDAMGVADRRVAHLERMVRDYWDGLIEKDLIQSMPDYLLNQTRGTQKRERSLVARQALFLLATYDPLAYAYLEKNNIQIYAAGLPGGILSKTEGSKAKGLWGIPIISYSTRFGEAAESGRPLQLAAFLAREAEFARGYPANFSGLVDLVTERIQGLFFEMPLTLEGRAWSAQARFYGHFHIYMSHAEETPNVPERAFPRLEIAKSPSQGSRLATAEAGVGSEMTRENFENAVLSKFNSRYQNAGGLFAFWHRLDPETWENSQKNDVGGLLDVSLLGTIFQKFPGIAKKFSEEKAFLDRPGVIDNEFPSTLEEKKNYFMRLREVFSILDSVLFEAAEMIEPIEYDESQSVDVDGYFIKSQTKGLYFDPTRGYGFLSEGMSRKVIELPETATGEAPRPEFIISLYRAAAEQEAEFGIGLKKFLGQCAQDFTANEAAYREFKQLLESQKKIATVLVDMLRSGILGKLFPEIEATEYLYTEPTHYFSVAAHTLYLFYFLDRMTSQGQDQEDGEFKEAREIYDQQLKGSADILVELRLAMLNHDLGKKQDGDLYGAPHPYASAEVQAPRILENLEVSSELARDIQWVIRYHHELHYYAFLARNRQRYKTVGLEDTAILNLVNIPGLTKKRLRILLALSLADRFSVNPAEWRVGVPNRFYLKEMTWFYDSVLNILNMDELIKSDELERLGRKSQEEKEALAGEIRKELEQAILKIPSQEETDQFISIMEGGGRPMSVREAEALERFVQEYGMNMLRSTPFKKLVHEVRWLKRWAEARRLMTDEYSDEKRTAGISAIQEELSEWKESELFNNLGDAEKKHQLKMAETLAAFLNSRGTSFEAVDSSIDDKAIWEQAAQSLEELRLGYQSSPKRKNEIQKALESLKKENFLRAVNALSTEYRDRVGRLRSSLEENLEKLDGREEMDRVLGDLETLEIVDSLLFDSVSEKLKPTIAGVTNPLEMIQRQLMSRLRVFCRSLNKYAEALGLGEEEKRDFKRRMLASFGGNFDVLFPKYIENRSAEYLANQTAQKHLMELLLMQDLTRDKAVSERDPENQPVARVIFGNHRDKYDPFFEMLIGVRGDQPGALAKILGVLAARGFSIAGADFKTMKDGLVLNWIYGYWTEAFDEALLKQDLKAVVSGEKTLDEIFSEEASKKEFRRDLGDKSVVVFDTFEARQSVLRVETPNGPARIFPVVMILQQSLGAEIFWSPIETGAARAVDRFEFTMPKTVRTSPASRVTIEKAIGAFLDRESFTFSDLRRASTELKEALNTLPVEDKAESHGARLAARGAERLAEIYGVRLVASSDGSADAAVPSDMKCIQELLRESLRVARRGFHLLSEEGGRVLTVTQEWLETAVAITKAVSIFKKIKETPGYDMHRPVVLVLLTPEPLSETAITRIRRMVELIQKVAGGQVSVRFATLLSGPHLHYDSDRPKTPNSLEEATVLIGPLSQNLLAAAKAQGHGVVLQAEPDSGEAAGATRAIFLEGLHAVAVQRSPKRTDRMNQLWSLLRFDTHSSFDEEAFTLSKIVTEASLARYQRLIVKTMPLVRWNSLFRWARQAVIRSLEAAA